LELMNDGLFQSTDFTVFMFLFISR
jgi:hypothetical protein